MLSLSGLHAFPLIWALVGSADRTATHADLLTAPICRDAEPREAPSSSDQTSDVLFHPLGLALFLGFFPPGFFNTPPAYPNDPKLGSGPGGGSGGDPGGGSGGDPGGGSGGDPGGGSGGDPGGGSGGPPPSAPEPATLISGMLGAGLIGLTGWRRRRKRRI